MIRLFQPPIGRKIRIIHSDLKNTILIKKKKHNKTREHLRPRVNYSVLMTMVVYNCISVSLLMFSVGKGLVQIFSPEARRYIAMESTGRLFSSVI